MDYFGLNDYLKAALREDVGTGDITTICCVPENSVSTGFFTAKEDGVICGVSVAARVFELLDAAVVVTPMVKDGDRVNRGEIIAKISGPSRSLLTGERVALNLMQHMSGIATKAYEATAAVKGTGAKIADTRKSTPGMRVLEKYAVRVGGGVNHRFNLSDGILIKDNHITAAGSITNAVDSVRKSAPHTLRIEVETETLEQVKEALDVGADIIMLDNMSPSQMEKAVALVAGRALTEASGNMGERDLLEVAKTGVDFISIGALTHSVKALDISLKLKSD